MKRLQNHRYIMDRGYFASVMAACALASARARDGALFSQQRYTSLLTAPSSETFYAAAKDALPKDMITAKGLDYLRACALLALTSIQYGNIEAMHQFIGQYFTLVAIQRLHDETLWPKDMNIIEREERRRLVSRLSCLGRDFPC